MLVTYGSAGRGIKAVVDASSERWIDTPKRKIALLSRVADSAASQSLASSSNCEELWPISRLRPVFGGIHTQNRETVCPNPSSKLCYVNSEAGPLLSLKTGNHL